MAYVKVCVGVRCVVYGDMLRCKEVCKGVGGCTLWGTCCHLLVFVSPPPSLDTTHPDTNLSPYWPANFQTWGNVRTSVWLFRDGPPLWLPWPPYDLLWCIACWCEKMRVLIWLVLWLRMYPFSFIKYRRLAPPGVVIRVWGPSRCCRYENNERNSSNCIWITYVRSC